jgi:hypothetical protein
LNDVLAQRAFLHPFDCVPISEECIHLIFSFRPDDKKKDEAGLCRAEDVEKAVKSGGNRSTRHIPEPGILAQHVRRDALFSSMKGKPAVPSPCVWPGDIQLHPG